MAATQPPDPRSFESWEDAFKYPIPVVRKFEQQLRKDVEENKQKLRSLVGASYRDLLRAAERIVDMDAQMKNAEQCLGEIGRRCNTRTLDRIVENHTKMRGRGEAEHWDGYRDSVQTKVLQSALAVMARLIKTGGDALLATKLHVLGRVLLKSVGESPSPPAVLKELRRRHGVLRRKLLVYIDRTLCVSARDNESIATVLCAYALLTSSSPAEVLRHFLELRYEELDSLCANTHRVDTARILDRFTATLAHTRSLFPRRFADALAQVSKAPLAQDPQVSATPQLSLDVYGTWIADDVRTFMPWVRHDQMTSTEIADALRSWTRQAQVCILEGLKEDLKTQDDASELLRSRHVIISKYLGLSEKVKSDSHAESVHQVRKAFLDRFLYLIDRVTSAPDLNLSESALGRPKKPSLNMWDLASADSDLTNGAARFRKSILNAHYGRDDMIRSRMIVYDEWAARLASLHEVIRKMGTEKWNDDYDVAIDDPADEQPFLDTFSKRDPEVLRIRLREASGLALREVYRSMERAPESERDASSLLRLLREVSQRHDGFGDTAAFPNDDAPNSEVVGSLHRIVAKHVAETALVSPGPSDGKHPRTSKILWDGDPPLPVQPSPSIFRFLTNLSTAMTEAGNDLWGPEAVKALKTILSERLPSHLVCSVATEPSVDRETLVNGHTEIQDAAENGEPRTNRDQPEHELTQVLFNILYLQRVMATSQHEVPRLALQTHSDVVRNELGLPDALYERLRKSAGEHWRRTHLLFGLLASDL